MSLFYAPQDKDSMGRVSFGTTQMDIKGGDNARTLRQRHGYEEKGQEAEEESDCDEKDLGAQEITPDVMATSIKAAFVKSHGRRKKPARSTKSVKAARRPSNIGRSK